MPRRIIIGLVVICVTALLPLAAHAAPTPERGQVANAVALPTSDGEARAFGRDLDGDGTRDNVLGSAFAALVAEDLDLGAAHDAAVAAGEVVMLHSLRTSSLADARRATWQVLHGVPVADPDFSGTGTFEVGFGLPRSARLDARIKDHVVKTSPGRLPVVLDLDPSAEDPQVVLELRKAVVRTVCRRSGCTAGRISGAVTTEQVGSELLPAIAAAIQSLIIRDCTGPEPGSCAAGSQGQALQQTFDADDDMTVTAEEVRASAPLADRLAPDLDLVGEDGRPGKDGVMDALSFGLGFTTVRATLTRP